MYFFNRFWNVQHSGEKGRVYREEWQGKSKTSVSGNLDQDSSTHKRYEAEESQFVFVAGDGQISSQWTKKKKNQNTQKTQETSGLLDMKTKVLVEMA